MPNKKLPIILIISNIALFVALGIVTYLFYEEVNKGEQTENSSGQEAGDPVDLWKEEYLVRANDLRSIIGIV